jgi:hypothetical protein
MRGEWRLAMVLDAQGRIVRWPKKLVQQDAVSAYLAKKFDRGVNYTEKEVNAVLEDWHTFNDWALLRRMLWDFRYMERERDGSRYWLAERAGTVASGAGAGAR